MNAQTDRSLTASSPRSRSRRRMGLILYAAAIYNILWSGTVIVAPDLAFNLAEMEPPRYPQIWQCLGMVIGVYGVGYWIAARDPLRHWPIVLVGLLGKVLGPLGFFKAALNGDLPWLFGLTIITNDLIWWVPFGWILWKARAAAARGYE